MLHTKEVIILEFKEQMIFCGNDSLKDDVQIMLKICVAWKKLSKVVLNFQAIKAKALDPHIHDSFSRITIFWCTAWPLTAKCSCDSRIKTGVIYSNLWHSKSHSIKSPDSEEMQWP